MLCQLWWLILCGHLTGLRDVQITGETLFLGVSVSVFLEKINFWISRFTLINVDRHPSNPLKANMEFKKKNREKAKFSLSSCARSSVFSSEPLVFRPSNSDTYTSILIPCPFSVLQTQTELYHCFSWLFSLQRTSCWTSQSP
jgi:hypothetical protein